MRCFTARSLVGAPRSGWRPHNLHSRGTWRHAVPDHWAHPAPPCPSAAVVLKVRRPADELLRLKQLMRGPRPAHVCETRTVPTSRCCSRPATFRSSATCARGTRLLRGRPVRPPKSIGRARARGRACPNASAARRPASVDATTCPTSRMGSPRPSARSSCDCVGVGRVLLPDFPGRCLIRACSRPAPTLQPQHRDRPALYKKCRPCGRYARLMEISGRQSSRAAIPPRRHDPLHGRDERGSRQ